MKILKQILDKIFILGDATRDISASSANPDIIKLNPFTLAFPKRLEESYLQNYYSNSIEQINVALILGVIFYSLFAFLDIFIAPEHFYEFLIVRFGVIWFIVVIVVIIINKVKNKKLSQPLLSVTATIVASTIIYFMIIAYPKFNSTYYVGIIIVYFWSYAFLKIRFIWATISGLVVLLFFQLATIFIIDLDYESYVISTSFLVAANLVGMGIAYSLEYYSRRDYYQKIMLEKSLNANVNLNTKINEGAKAISLAEEKLMLQSKALESAANSIIILNIEGNIIWSNPAFSKLTGYSSEEVSGKNPRLLKSGKHDKIFYKNIWSTILEGRIWAGEIINKKKNGDIYFEEMTITPVIDNLSEKVTHFIAIKQDITLRKHMEEELSANEKRFRSLFENATLGIYRSTLDGDILMANNALIKMLDFDSIEDLKKRDLTSAGYVNPKQREEFISRLMEKGSLVGFESEWRKKDGSVIFIRESARLDKNNKDEAVFEGTVEDISLSKIAEVKLRESSERLQTVFDNLNDAIIIHNLEGKIIDVNNKVLDLLNVSREDILTLFMKDISSKDSPIELAEKYWPKVINKDRTYKFEWKAMRPTDNFVFDVEIFLSKIIIDNKSYVLANIRDITEQKKANRNLLLTQKAVDLNATPIFWISKEAKFIYVNNAAEKQLGYTFDELIQMRISDIDPYWDDEYFNKIGYPRLKKQGVDHFESIHKRKDGEEFPIEVNSTLINYENEEVIIANILDITERKKAAESIVNAKEKAEQSDKLKSEFLAGMSHEIRTPINTILNFVSLIKSDLGENTTEDIKSSFEMIDNGSRRLIRTIDSIINMSQLSSGSYEQKIELISIVDDVLKQLYQEFKQAANQKNLDFELEVETTELNVFADNYTLTQLLINLIDNALKYTNKGSVKIVVESDDKFTIINIIDTGVGISEEFIPLLFDPFLQEEMGYTRSFEGNGLGLALVKKYLELNNGTIDVKSEKGAGSTFSVKLPKPTEREINVYNVTKVLN